MFDAKSLLNQFLGAQLGEKAGGMLDKTRDFISQETDALMSEGGLAQGLERGKAFAQENAGVLLGGAAAGSLATLLVGTQRGRALSRGALKLGGLAALGALAYKAYGTWQQQQVQHGQAVTPVATPDIPMTVVPSAAGGVLLPQAEGEQQALALLALKAMIAAAACDGHIDATERSRILGRLTQAGLEDGAQAFLAAQMTSPATPEQLAQAATTPELAAALYASTLLVLDVDSAAETAYLAELAQALRLDGALIAQLEHEVAQLRAGTPV